MTEKTIASLNISGFSRKKDPSFWMGEKHPLKSF